MKRTTTVLSGLVAIMVIGGMGFTTVVEVRVEFGRTAVTDTPWEATTTAVVAVNETLE